MKNKLIVFICCFSLIFSILSISVFALPNDYTYPSNSIESGVAYKLKDSITPFSFTKTACPCYAYTGTTSYFYTHVTTLDTGGIVLVNELEGSSVPPRLLYNSDGVLQYNGYIQFSTVDSTNPLYICIYAPFGVLGRFYLENPSTDALDMITTNSTIIFNDVTYESFQYLNGRYLLQTNDNTYVVVYDDGFLLGDITVTFNNPKYLPISDANTFYNYWSLTDNASSDLSPYYVFNQSYQFYTPLQELDISGFSSSYPFFTFDSVDVLANEIRLVGDTVEMVYDGSTFSNSIIKFNHPKYESVLYELGYFINPIGEGQLRNYSFTLLYNSSFTDSFYYVSESNITLQGRGENSYNTLFVGNEIIVNNGEVFLFNGERFYQVNTGQYLIFDGDYSSSFISRFRSYGDIVEGDGLTGDTVTLFFENLFTVPERAMSNLVLFQTPNGTYITLFTVVSTAISLCFIFWILKLIAGG